jgi:hypothetical protein
MLKNVILQQKEERDMLLSKKYQTRVSVIQKDSFLASGLKYGS